MFYGDTIQDTRQLFFNTWKKYQDKQSLSTLENDILKVMLDHPEYHSFFDNPETFREHHFYPELGDTNPFLHMGLHIAIREQIATNRPLGIKECYLKLLKHYPDSLSVEHAMMEQLAECLWLSQKNNLPPDETHYLASLNDLCRT